MPLPLLAASLLLSASPARSWQPPAERALDELVRAAHPAPLPDRIAWISARFLGAPYELGPLGEGPGNLPDPDPLWRWDAVDCVTFVEEVLALCDSSSLLDAESTLQRIRYAGDTIRYDQRNHLMESDWLPNNLRKGFVREGTKEVAGEDARYLWRRAFQGRGMVRDVALPYLPLDKALDHAADIPSGTIFFIAREWYRHVPDHVSHVGFFVRKNGKLYARHASSAHGRVVDEPFERFVAEQRRSIARWPVLGFELVMPTEPSEAVSASP